MDSIAREIARLDMRAMLDITAEDAAAKTDEELQAWLESIPAKGIVVKGDAAADIASRPRTTDS